MDNITFTWVLHSHVLKDGTRKIILRITQARKHKYVDIGYSIKEEDWNNEKREVRRTNRLSNEINMVMDRHLIEAKQTYLINKSQDLPITAKEIKRKLKKELVGTNFFEYADSYVANLLNGNTESNRISILNKLKDFVGRDSNGQPFELLFPEIDYKFLTTYERHLKKIGNSANTIRTNMKFLKTVYNDAIKSRHFRTLDNPWLEYTFTKHKSQRTRLNVAKIAEIENYVSKPGTRRRDAQNMFLFSFYLQGMRVGDLLHLEWRQIKGNYLEYRAGKTKKARPRKLISKALAILEYYRKPDQKPTDRIFPFLQGVNQKDYTSAQYAKLIDSKNSKIRTELMRIAKDLGYEKLSMHVARHTWASIARKITGDVHLVSDSLDHSSIAITEGYFADAEPEENDELVFKVFGE